MIGGVTCPNCGKDNPDFLDKCQFCQATLRSESTLNTGENPTKKVTGDLEPILPDWLREMRQQGRTSAEEDAANQTTKPKVQKEEPLDLLAGLAFQAASDEDEVPDWLASINPKPAPASKPDENAPSDFFAQFNKSPSEPAAPSSAETPNDGLTGKEPSQPFAQEDELSNWLAQASAQPEETFSFDSGALQDEKDWMDNLGTPAVPAPEPAAPQEPEDLGWLHDLESSAKQTPAPQAGMDWMANIDPSSAQPSGSQDDLSWLNNLGGVSAPSFEESAPAQPASSQDDLGWLNNLAGTSMPASQEPVPSKPKEDLSWLNNQGGTSAPSFDEPVPSQPASSQDDLGWLNNLGSTSAPSFDEPASSQPASSQDDLGWLNNLGSTSAPSFQEPVPSQPASSQDDLGWLNNLGTTSEPSLREPAPAQPVSSQDDLDWLKSLDDATTSSDLPASRPFADTAELNRANALDNQGGIPSTPVSPFTPRRTAPLEDTSQNATPEWLKSALEASSESMPPLGASSMDEWFSSQGQPVDEKETPALPPLQPASIEPVLAAPESESSSLSSQDVDSLFSIQMPDWLANPESGTGNAAPQETPTSAQANASLAPVDLPSWVQAMRPVESVLNDQPSTGSIDQNTEKEGPLAGLRGVIPFAPIGSSRRPKAISLKLQATDEQQAGASLFEQILAGETTPHPLKSTAFVAAQRTLRWVLTALFLLILGTLIGLGTRIMPVSAALPVEVSHLSNVILNMPESAPVLVVMDYESALAGEMEAVAGPLLSQMVLLRHPNFTFVSTSPNGSALVEHLMTNTKINRPAPDGLGYMAGSQYLNIGYLAGGSAGVRSFVENPKTAVPSTKAGLFADFAAVIVVTDHAESAQVWVEQLEYVKQTNPALASQPLLVAASAQAGPLLQPYVSSRQVDGMLSGLSDAARYEYVNNSGPRIARTYWDAFGVGILIAIISIVLGSLWNLFTGIRARRAEAEQG